MKENLAAFRGRPERFLYSFGYKVYSELKSILKHRDVGAKIVIFKEEKDSVLLVRHQYKGENLWYLPGGGVQVGERPDEAIKRELDEELRLKIKKPALLGIYKGKEKKGGLTFLFYSYGEGELGINPGSEIEEARFFPLKHLPENLALGVEKRINEVLGKIEEDILESPEIIWGEW